MNTPTHVLAPIDCPDTSTRPVDAHVASQPRELTELDLGFAALVACAIERVTCAVFAGFAAMLAARVLTGAQATFASAMATRAHAHAGGLPLTSTRTPRTAAQRDRAAARRTAETLGLDRPGFAARQRAQAQAEAEADHQRLIEQLRDLHPGCVVFDDREPAGPSL